MPTLPTELRTCLPLPGREKGAHNGSMKTGIGASLPADLFAEFNRRAVGFPGGKTGLIKEALRSYFASTPLPETGADNAAPEQPAENV